VTPTNPAPRFPHTIAFRVNDRQAEVAASLRSVCGGTFAEAFRWLLDDAEVAKLISARVRGETGRAHNGIPIREAFWTGVRDGGQVIEFAADIDLVGNRITGIAPYDMTDVRLLGSFDFGDEEVERFGLARIDQCAAGVQLSAEAYMRVAP
jgi:hypothetical protein